jgi:hypothetical protein
MRNGKGLVFLIFIGWLVVSCEPEVGFMEPQPSEINETNKFKRKFIGKYLCVKDSSILVISKSGILQNWNFEVFIDSNENWESAVRNINVEVNEADLRITPQNDSSSFIVDYTREIFGLRENRVLKYVDRTYYLNDKNRDNTWEVSVLKFDSEGFLVLKEINIGTDDLEYVRNTTEVSETVNEEGKIVAYQIRPSIKELNELLEANLFVNGQKFIRIK